MSIWSSEIKELESLYTSLKGRFPELEKDLEHLIKTDDENVALLYARRCLEIIVTDLCECELKRPRKTEPLKGIIDKLHREEKVPSHIITSMESLNSLSTYGTHPKEFDPEQVRPILLNLATIIKWYVKYKDTQTIGKAQPEEGKHESKEQIDTREGTHKSNKKLILILSGIVVTLAIIVAALFIFNVIGGKKETKEIEKSIAVLPFLDDSQDKENSAFINGIMDEILINLQTIRDLRVPGRTSVEQYRNSTKSIPEIAKELGVNYIVEGSGQKYGNTFRLRVQLLEGSKDKHLWGESYEQKIEKVEDIFTLQNQIAETIAAELKAIITPEEKQLIEKTPTASLTAYDFYQRGRDEFFKYWINNDNRAALETAEDFYNKALEYDSTFAEAYSSLARVYYDKHGWEEYLSKNYLDSVLVLADRALSYNNQLSDAYWIRAVYYYINGNIEQTYKEIDKTLKYNPNYWEAYQALGYFYMRDSKNLDFVKALVNLKEAVNINHGRELPSLLRNLGDVYGLFAGFHDKANFYYQEAFKLDRDSARYMYYLGKLEESYGNFKNSIEFYEKAYATDSNSTDILMGLGWSYLWHYQYENSLKYFKKYIEKSEVSGQLRLNNMQRIGYTYFKNRFKKEADYYFNEQKRYCEESIKAKRSYAVIELAAYYDLAGVYAFLGDTDKAYENLKIWAKMPVCPLWWLNLIKVDPLFDNIKNEPEFQQIIRDMEAKYQAEHERVRKWMEEQGEL